MKKKGYGIDQVAHYFLSEPDKSGKEGDKENTGDGIEKTESIQGRGPTHVLRIASEVDKAAIQRKDLVDAAEDFLLHYQGNPEIGRIPDIASPDFGTADLTFANHSKDRLILVMVNTGKEIERFVVLSVAYYLWIKELFSAGKSILRTKVDIDLFCFSPRFSKAVGHTVAAYRKSGIRIHLMGYRLFQVKGLAEPVIHFRSFSSSHATSPGKETSTDPAQAGPDSRKDHITGTTQVHEKNQPFGEFMRLRHYLDD